MAADDLFAPLAEAEDDWDLVSSSHSFGALGEHGQYGAVKLDQFSPNTQSRHPMSHPWGPGMGCFCEIELRSTFRLIIIFDIVLSLAA